MSNIHHSAINDQMELRGPSKKVQKTLESFEKRLSEALLRVHEAKKCLRDYRKDVAVIDSERALFLRNLIGKTEAIVPKTSR